jgi:pyruvate/2-oxoglutarate dehydrogenase complex dihydrolipoamide acyltransferase (E2) component
LRRNLKKAHKRGEKVVQMTGLSLTVVLLVCILLVSVMILAVAIRNLLSSRRSEVLGEDRYELVRDQWKRLESMREERQMLTEELERQSRERQQLTVLLGKTPRHLVEDVKKEREERIEDLKQDRLRLEEELHQLEEQLERERSGTDYRPREKPPQEVEGKEAIEPSVERPPGPIGADPEATDAAMRKAEELGVDLSKVEGSGVNGRIRIIDVVNAATQERREGRG